MRETGEKKQVSLLSKLGYIFDKRDKWKLVLRTAAIVVGSFFELLAVMVFVPFIDVLQNQNIIQDRWYLKAAFNLFHFRSNKSFVALISVGIIGIYVIKNIYLILEKDYIFRFSYNTQMKLSTRLLAAYMKEPYTFHLNHNIAILQRSLHEDTSRFMQVILYALELGAELMVSGVLVIYLLVVSKSITIIVLGFLAAFVGGFLMISRKYSRRLGLENQGYQGKIFQWMNQALGGIKEIKIARRERYFINEYSKCGAGYVSAVQRYNLYNATPRLLIETLAIAGMILYLMIQLLQGTAAADIVPQLGLLAVAAMRLIPCANRINNHLTSISYFEPFFMGVSDNLQEEIRDENVDYSAETYLRKEEVEKLPVRKEIVLQDITYKYPNSETLIFDHAVMKIPIGKSVGIVGTSGAGKTTIVDILLGLLQLESGRILADGVEVREHYASWLKNIGYIPQSIFMIDSTIRRNVAFGCPDEEIDDDKVWEALREAQLDEFVRGLPEGLDTGIGERGIRISGGQRQRIGIARALFEDPEVLVLDEATSALDNETEAAIMDSINRLHGRKTLIIIAHRLQTIEKCDMVYRVVDGKAVVEKEFAGK